MAQSTGFFGVQNLINCAPRPSVSHLPTDLVPDSLRGKDRHCLEVHIEPVHDTLTDRQTDKVDIEMTK